MTVSITRHVAPDRVDQMIAWVRAGSALAERFPGFLGTGWVRPGADSDEWHMLYRFDSAESLGAWEASDQRTWWLGSAQGLVGESLRERRTGIEGWFDEPVEHDVEDLAPAARGAAAVEAVGDDLDRVLPAQPARGPAAGWLAPELPSSPGCC